jgi:four helix bundle protein
MRNYRNIKAFQLADDLAFEVYKVTRDFPKEELYGLTSQLRRAGVSVAANIAEGASRKHKKDYMHFLYIARASLAEVEYLLHLSKRLHYLAEESYLIIEEKREETAKTLFGLINAVEKEIKQTIDIGQ